MATKSSEPNLFSWVKELAAAWLVAAALFGSLLLLDAVAQPQWVGGVGPGETAATKVHQNSASFRLEKR